MIAEARTRIQHSQPIEQTTPATLMERAGLTPEPWQVDILTSPARDLCLLAARQVGKSTVTAALTLHTAITQPGSLSLITAPSERQSKELLRKVTQLYRALDRPVAADTEGKIELELSNGSRILALPASESTTRGLSNVAILVADEAAYLAENVYLGMLPALAADGRKVVLSTPWAKGSWLYREWTEGADWARVKVTVHDSAQYTPERIAKMKRSMPDHWWRSQYLCEWIEAGGSVFAFDDIQATLDSDVQPLWSIPAVVEEDTDYALPLW